MVPTVCVNTYNRGNSEPLVHQLSQHLEPTQIIVVTGGSRVTSVRMTHTHCQVSVRHNSVDFTSHIAIVEHRKRIEKCIKRPLRSFLYVHDTCSVRPHFFTWLVTHYSDETAKLISARFLKYSCNLGIYNVDELCAIQGFLTGLKSTTVTTTEANACKGMSIIFEDIIFDHLGTTRNLGTKWRFEGYSRLRVKLYFPVIGLLKYQANGFWCPWSWWRSLQYRRRAGMCPLG